MIDTVQEEQFTKQVEKKVVFDCSSVPPEHQEETSKDRQSSSSSRSKRRAETEPESHAIKHQRVKYEWAHASLAKENRNAAQDYLKKHEQKIEEYTVALMNIEDDSSLGKVKAQYSKLIQHHYNKVKKAKKDAVRFQKQREHHLRRLKLAALDLKMASSD